MLRTDLLSVGVFLVGGFQQLTVYVLSEVVGAPTLPGLKGFDFLYCTGWSLRLKSACVAREKQGKPAS